jgi:hypothetical protein
MTLTSLRNTAEELEPEDGIRFKPDAKFTITDEQGRSVDLTEHLAQQCFGSVENIDVIRDSGLIHEDSVLDVSNVSIEADVLSALEGMFGLINEV